MFPTNQRKFCPDFMDKMSVYEDVNDMTAKVEASEWTTYEWKWYWGKGKTIKWWSWMVQKLNKFQAYKDELHRIVNKNYPKVSVRYWLTDSGVIKPLVLPTAKIVKQEWVFTFEKIP